LIHEAHAIVFDHQGFGHVIAGAKFNDPVAAAAATGTEREVGIEIDA
jgi:hypothetical protein